MVTTQPEGSNASFQNQQLAMNNYENAVFVSYAWGDESEHIVGELEQAFAQRGIRIVRDKKDLDYKGSIEAFERRIGRGQCIILIISDKYLRSEHCMHELVEADKNRNLRDRIFPIVLAESKIYKAVDRLNYIQHWDEQIEELNQAIKKVKVMANLSGITADLNKYASIQASFDHLTDLLSDMNTLTPELHAASGFSTLVDAVEHVLADKKNDIKSIIEGMIDSDILAMSERHHHWGAIYEFDKDYWTDLHVDFVKLENNERLLERLAYFILGYQFGMENVVVIDPVEFDQHTKHTRGGREVVKRLASKMKLPMVDEMELREPDKPLVLVPLYSGAVKNFINAHSAHIYQVVILLAPVNKYLADNLTISPDKVKSIISLDTLAQISEDKRKLMITGVGR